MGCVLVCVASSCSRIVISRAELKSTSRGPRTSSSRSSCRASSVSSLSRPTSELKQMTKLHAAGLIGSGDACVEKSSWTYIEYTELFSKRRRCLSRSSST